MNLNLLTTPPVNPRPVNRPDRVRNDMGVTKVVHRLTASRHVAVIVNDYIATDG